MGRVVKGARIAQQRYQVKPPPALAVPQVLESPAAFDDPIFAEMHAPDPQPAAAQNVLEAARAQAEKLVADARDDAETLLRDAQEHAVALVEDAQRRVAQIESEAKGAGFDQGLHDGRAAAEAEMEEMLATMRGLLEMARAERHKIIEGAEPEIVRLSVAIAERILNQHVALDEGAVVEMARAAITRLVNRETVTVRVNPADIETMRRSRDKFMSMNDIDNLRVIEDQRVDRGGVVIETEAGTIDAKISTQLREVRRRLAIEDTIAVSESSEPALINPPAQAS